MGTKFEERVRQVVDPELHRVIDMFQSTEQSPDLQYTGPSEQQFESLSLLTADIKTELEPINRKEKKKDADEEEEKDDDEKSPLEDLADKVQEALEHLKDDLLEHTTFGDHDDDGVPNFLDVDDNLRDLKNIWDFTSKHIRDLIMTGQKIGEQITNSRRHAKQIVLAEKQLQQQAAQNGLLHKALHYLQDGPTDLNNPLYRNIMDAVNDASTSEAQHTAMLSEQLDGCCENIQLLINDTNRRINTVDEDLNNCCSQMSDKMKELRQDIMDLSNNGIWNNVMAKIGMLHADLSDIRRYL